MNVGKDLILVTGATGQQGGAVAHELLAAGHRVRVMTRKPDGEAAKALAALGAEVVKGDLDDPASLKQALAGAWGVFAVQNTWEAGVEQEEVQGKRIAELAKAAGVQHFVYSSVGSAHRHTGIPHFDNKARVEATVRQLGFPAFVILRPVFFMENWTSPWFKPYIDQGTLAVSVKPDTKLQMIAVADVGKYGKVAFEKHAELNGQAIDIAGDELTMPQTAEVIGKAAGKAVSHFQVPIEEVRKASEDFALMLEWFDAQGYEADIPGNAKRFGIKPTTLADWARKAPW